MNPSPAALMSHPSPGYLGANSPSAGAHNVASPNFLPSPSPMGHTLASHSPASSFAPGKQCRPAVWLSLLSSPRRQWLTWWPVRQLRHKQSFLSFHRCRNDQSFRYLQDPSKQAFCSCYSDCFDARRLPYALLATAGTSGPCNPSSGHAGAWEPQNICQMHHKSRKTSLLLCTFVDGRKTRNL